MLENKIAIECKRKLIMAEVRVVQATAPVEMINNYKKVKRTPPKKPPRRVCNNCRCGKEDHEITEDTPIEERLTHIKMKDDNDNITDEEKILSNYAWLPPGLDVALVQEYMSSLPKNNIPRYDNTDGIKYRNKQLVLQLPLQDASPDNCKFLPENSRGVHDKFRKDKEEAMGTGHVEAAFRTKTCRGCTKDIPMGSVYVIAFRLGEDAVWHPSCFTCATCNELLADLIYFCQNKENKEDKIYCGRHFGELLKPRCKSCDEIIFTGEYVNAADKSYHMDHFCCFICDTSLNGEAHLLEDNKPLCIECYNNKYSNPCHKCDKAISVEDKDIIYDNHHWHDSCLICIVCTESLSDKSFLVRDEDGAFVCTACHKKTDSRRCKACCKGFEPGSKRLELNGMFWHDDCFSCEICKNTISSRKFMRHENKVVCVTCYEEYFVKKCFGCKKPLTAGGISYNGQPYHRDCFCCHNCQASIASTTFSVRDEQYYCTDCFASLFGKKCKGCDSFILNGEYFTLDDNSWHKECFKCETCGNILAQSTFVQEGDQIKLMCESCMIE